MTKQERDELRAECTSLHGTIYSITLKVSTIRALLDELDMKDAAYVQGFEDAKEMAAHLADSIGREYPIAKRGVAERIYEEICTI